MNWKYSEDRKKIELENEPKRFKYLTGTRFASALGLNPYSSKFQIWCECTRLVTPPFEDTIYTIAGKTIEKFQREYISQKFPNIKSPEEYFGNIFDDVRWNFFDEQYKPFAGCWDAVSVKNNGKDIQMVVEFKTANSPLKWQNNTVPPYYELQGALYAKLLGLDEVLFVASFLDKIDYAHPEDFVPSKDNTIMIVRNIKDIVVEIDGQYYDIDGCMEKAKEFWDKYVLTGISPEFDEVKDKEYLDIIRQSKPCEDNDLVDVCKQAIELAKQIDELKISSGLNAMEKELKVLENSIKETMINNEIENCENYKLKKTIKTKFNEKLFAENNQKAYEDYLEEVVAYTLSKDKKEKENE